jgi:hypothetical protein
MHKNATKYKQNTKQLVLNKHGASKIIDTFMMYQWYTNLGPEPKIRAGRVLGGVLGAPVEMLLELATLHPSADQDSVSWALKPSTQFSIKSLYLRLVQGVSVAYAKDI